MEHSPVGTQRRRLYGALSLGAVLAGALIAVGLVDPHNANSIFPICPFRLLTGWNCPFCGGLRMTHDVLHGDLLAAITDNVFLLVGLPMLAAWLWLRRHRRESRLSLPALVTIVAVTVVWTVLRNLPGFPLVPTLFTG